MSEVDETEAGSMADGDYADEGNCAILRGFERGFAETEAGMEAEMIILEEEVDASQ